MKLVAFLILLSLWSAGVASNLSGTSWGLVTALSGVLFVAAFLVLHHTVNQPKRGQR